MANLEVTLQPTTKDETGADLPATGPAALISHRVQYGSLNGNDFGTVLGEAIIAMPDITAVFPDVAPGAYAVRAFASNSYGEGKAYPLSLIGPVPSAGGEILVIRMS